MWRRRYNHSRKIFRKRSKFGRNRYSKRFRYKTIYKRHSRRNIKRRLRRRLRKYNDQYALNKLFRCDTSFPLVYTPTNFEGSATVNNIGMMNTLTYVIRFFNNSLKAADGSVDTSSFQIPNSWLHIKNYSKLKVRGWMLSVKNVSTSYQGNPPPPSYKFEWTGTNEDLELLLDNLTEQQTVRPETLNPPCSGTIYPAIGPIPSRFTGQVNELPDYLPKYNNIPLISNLFFNYVSLVPKVNTDTPSVGTCTKQLPIKVFLDRKRMLTNIESNEPSASTNKDFSFPHLTNIGLILKPGQTRKWFFKLDKAKVANIGPTAMQSFLTNDYGLQTYVDSYTTYKSNNFYTDLLVYCDATQNLINSKQLDPETGVSTDQVQLPNPFIQLMCKVSLWIEGTDSYMCQAY